MSNIHTKVLTFHRTLLLPAVVVVRARQFHQAHDLGYTVRNKYARARLSMCFFCLYYVHEARSRVACASRNSRATTENYGRSSRYMYNDKRAQHVPSTCATKTLSAERVLSSFSQIGRHEYLFFAHQH